MIYGFWVRRNKRQECDLFVWTAKLQLVLLGTIWQWPTDWNVDFCGGSKDDYFGHYWLEKKY